MKISDHLVQFDETEQDRNILKKECSPINIRLYQHNWSYRKIILEIIRYMDEHLNSTFDDYPPPRGVAAPNLGFPFKIIGYRKTINELQFFLNPSLIFKSPTLVETTSNCGSLRLADPLRLKRHSSIDVEYYDLEGNIQRLRNILKTEGSTTIQNAIDQINGITILDRFEEAKNESQHP